MASKKNILVAPINWGLGHATRCIPLIEELLKNDYNVIIASDGQSLNLLKKEFPTLKAIELPPYNIKYPKKGYLFKWKMISQCVSIKRTIRRERKFVSRLVQTEELSGIISDGRLGVRSSKIPSVYITHQINILTGTTTSISSLIHQFYIKKYKVCWVPDDSRRVAGLSGKMGHPKNRNLNIRYLGILSRLEKKELPISIEYLAIISGPEPQRSLLEKILIQKLRDYKGKVVLVQGIISEKQVWQKVGNIDMVNFMQAEELEEYMNKASVIISRSGYSTILDLAKLKKKAFFIPTPGQYEQEYLARRMQHLGLVPCCEQDKFSLEHLSRAQVYLGINLELPTTDMSKLFEVFHN